MSELGPEATLLDVRRDRVPLVLDIVRAVAQVVIAIALVVIA